MAVKNMVRSGKQNRHEKIAVVLLSGKPVTPDEIKDVFDGTDQADVLYRLSTNIYNIRLDGGVVKVAKNGRQVVSYQLMNPQDFDKDGRFIQKNEAGKVIEPATIKAVKQSKSAKTVKTPAKVETKTVKAKAKPVVAKPAAGRATKAQIKKIEAEIAAELEAANKEVVL